MNATSNPLIELANRARAGDPSAEVELRQWLMAGFPQVVRQALRTGGGSSPIDPHILGAYRRFDPSRHEEQEVVELITGRVCNAALTLSEDAPARTQLAGDTIRGV